MESKFQLNLLKLYCYAQDETDGDEIFLKSKNSKIWPVADKFKKVKVGEYDLNVMVEVPTESTMSIELWDWDLLSANDKLGEFNMLVNEKGGPFKTDLSPSTGEDAKYSLEWEVC